MQNSPADTKVREEAGRNGAPCTGAEIPLQSIEKTMGKQIATLQHTDDHVGADIHTAAMADTLPEQMDVL